MDVRGPTELFMYLTHGVALQEPFDACLNAVTAHSPYTGTLPERFLQPLASQHAPSITQCRMCQWAGLRCDTRMLAIQDPPLSTQKPKMTHTHATSHSEQHTASIMQSPSYKTATLTRTLMSPLSLARKHPISHPKSMNQTPARAICENSHLQQTF